MDYFFENRNKASADHIPLSIFVKNNLSFQAHWHTEFELLYVESGSILASVNNDRRKLVAGDIVISTNGDIHYYKSNNRDSRAIVLIFKPEYFGLAANWLDTRQFISPFQHGSTGQTQIKAVLLAILAEKQTQKEFYELFIKAQITELCALMLRFFPSQPLTQEMYNQNLTKFSVLQDILAYIESNFSEEITLELLAAKFKLDIFNLSKSFNAITGSNLRTYINTLRVSKSKSLILNTRKPLIEIAFDCGFNSVRTFNRVFKNLTGRTPSSFRDPKN